MFDWKGEGICFSIEDKGGRILTVLTAISLFGVELIMVIEGAVDTPAWCYFISEV